MKCLFWCEDPTASRKFTCVMSGYNSSYSCCSEIFLLYTCSATSSPSSTPSLHALSHHQKSYTSGKFLLNSSLSIAFIYHPALSRCLPPSLAAPLSPSPHIVSLTPPSHPLLLSVSPYHSPSLAISPIPSLASCLKSPAICRHLAHPLTLSH